MERICCSCGHDEPQQVLDKAVRLVKNIQMQGTRNPEE
jgi:hypothetical protein